MSGQGKYDTSVCGQESWYLYWLAGVPGIGMRTMQKLMGHFGRASRVYQASCEELQQVSGITPSLIEQITSREGRDQSRQSWSALSQRGIRYVSFYGDDYPERLQKIFDPPVHLYVRGGLPDPSRRSIGIVGARNCTLYGRDMARLFGYRLAGAGVQVISGMAAGIDGCSHQGALEGGGKTFGILGGGVDVCYPEFHRELYMRLEQQGGLLSESPPGIRPMRHLFPLRNRIISGLADMVLIIEAKAKSGSLITADLALEQGRDVYAVPGRLEDSLSTGCNNLIHQGAGIALSPEQILEELGINGKLKKQIKKHEKNDLEMAENIVYSCLGLQAQGPEELCIRTKLPLIEVLRILTSLELKGYAKEVYKNNFIRVL